MRHSQGGWFWGNFSQGAPTGGSGDPQGGGMSECTGEVDRKGSRVNPVIADRASRGRGLECPLSEVVFEGRGLRGCFYRGGVIWGS